MNASEALAHYDRALAISEGMLAAARQEDWDALVSLESERRAVVDELTSQTVPFSLASEVAEKDACIRRIVEVDEIISGLVERWKAEARETLNSVQSQRKLENAYRSG